jgi:hypothetical protein
MTGVRLTKRGFLVILTLFLSLFSWYFSFSFSVLAHIVGSSTENYLMVNASFNFIIVITLVLSKFFIHRFNKIHIIYGYSITTSIAGILLLLTSSSVLKLIIVFAAGIPFSIGLLASFTYFWSLTASVERGRAAGLAGFFTLPITHLIGIMAETSDFSGTVMIGVILSLGTLAISLLNPENKAILTTKKDEKGQHPEKRTILLYTIPWILFSLINITLARNISIHVFQLVPSSLYVFLLVLQMIASGFGALGGGIIADLFGRRFSLGFSLTLYGISTALGAFVENFGVLYFIYVANGLSWGILWTLYAPVVWGDLADKESIAKRYSLGLIIYYLSLGIGFLLSNQISRIPIITSSLVGCILVFISNIPLIFAPELLSPDFRERIKLKLYMNIVRKIRRKSSL